MKWKVDEPAALQPNDNRTNTKFAFFPKRIGGAMYWLCQYEELQVWVVSEIPTIKGQPLTFSVGNWVTVSIKPIRWIPA